jgi:hypothetical protein
MKNRTLLQSLFIGAKEGWNLSTLPENKLKFHEHPYTRIFRVLGGICFLLIMTKKVLLFPKIFLYLIVLISLMHLSNINYIFISRWIHLIWLYKNGKLEIHQ